MNSVDILAADGLAGSALAPDPFAAATDTCLLYTSPSPRDS